MRCRHVVGAVPGVYCGRGYGARRGRDLAVDCVRDSGRDRAPSVPGQPRDQIARHRPDHPAAVGWAAATAVFGVDPSTDDRLASMVHYVTAGFFQLGILVLLGVIARERALGAGRVARCALAVQATLVTVSLGTTLARIAGAYDPDRGPWALLDVAWPLSMLGMLLVAIGVAVAGRWRGAARAWTPVAASWGPVMLVTFGAFGETAAGVVSTVHLLAGYAVLGVLLARRER